MISVDKTKVLATFDDKRDIDINYQKLQQVDTFKYLAAVITDDTECTRHPCKTW